MCVRGVCGGVVGRGGGAYYYYYCHRHHHHHHEYYFYCYYYHYCYCYCYYYYYYYCEYYCCPSYSYSTPAAPIAKLMLMLFDDEE